jgi:hypothetical protein
MRVSYQGFPIPVPEMVLPTARIHLVSGTSRKAIHFHWRDGLITTIGVLPSSLGVNTKDQQNYGWGYPKEKRDWLMERKGQK